MTNVSILSALLIVAILVALGVAYWQYLNWPPRVWRERLRSHLDQLRTRLNQLPSAGRDAQDVGRLHAEYFSQYLRSISVHRLAEFPGIGPMTVERLKSAGYANAADCLEATFEGLAGIGPAKASELRNAVRGLLQKTRSRFDAGSCTEAEEYQAKLQSIPAAERLKLLNLDRERQALQSAAGETEKRLELVRLVTAEHFLQSKPIPNLTEAMMNAPLPVAEWDPVTASELEEQAAHTPPKPTDAKPPGYDKLAATVGLAFAIAKADGRITPAERKQIRSFLAESVGGDPRLLRHIDPVMDSTAKAVPEPDAAIEALMQQTTEQERRAYLLYAEAIADVSGDRSPEEKEVLKRLSLAFGLVLGEPAAAEAEPEPEPAKPEPIPEVRKPQPRSSVPPPAPSAPVESAPDHRAVLEIEPGMPLDPELIRRRYNLLNEKLDPAKAATMGHEFARLAEEKRTRLRVAAEALLTPFGEPLEKLKPPPPADMRHNPDLDAAFGL